ncbi:hypothetical protein GCM10010495_52280 [Kitasatospora herbaricolor]|uniref:hypothetical protein n=1 Tax=Kitasatospora herbaricolor TaxID=68217 RepID=UPI0019A5DBAD|nr:hypothetical protein [Kitasatospora herbaricolor]GGV29658.1 hypothetical protein GCM10010495_52280 [Kitasatospora herbaricolor]
MSVTHLLLESEELGYTGSANLLVRHITQGRAEGDRPVTTPQRFARLLLSRAEDPRDKDTTQLWKLCEACSEGTELAHFSRAFAQLMMPAEGNDATLLIQ